MAIEIRKIFAALVVLSICLSVILLPALFVKENGMPSAHYQTMVGEDVLEVIPDELVPLSSAPASGNSFSLWAVMIISAALPLLAFNVSDKKSKEED